MKSQNLGKVFTRSLIGRFVVPLCGLLGATGVASAQQYLIQTICGIPQVQGWFGDGAAATGAQLYQPSKVVVDKSGNYYISDYFSAVVRMVTASTGFISTVAGNGTYGFAGDNDLAVNANVSDVHGIAVDSSGNIYISDTGNHRIRKITLSSGDISTFAGNGTGGYAGDGAAANVAELALPAALAFDSSGNLYVSDYGNYTIRKINSAGVISTVAGTGSFGSAGDGGPASKAKLGFPVTMAFDSAGNLFVGDLGSSSIRRIGTDGNISTYISNVTPQGIAVDSVGNLYMVDGLTPVVWEILKGGAILTIAGTGQAGYGGDGAGATAAQLNSPAGVAVDSSGNVYVADTNNQIIRQLNPLPFSVGGMTNAASGIQGPIAPGEIVTVYGAGMGPATLTTFTISNGYIGTQIGGTSLYFSGYPAPLLYSSATLMAAIVPYGVAGLTTANVALNNGSISPTTVVPVANAAPGIFTANSAGFGQAAALNQDGSSNSASKPAKAGSYISLYITGDGAGTIPVNDGQILSSPPYPQTVLPVTVTVGGIKATVTYSGATPTAVAGLTQVNVQIPAAVASGPAVPIALQVGGVPAQSGVTIAVQ